MKKQDGFTLIEMIIVIIVLGILAAYAVPKYVSIEKEARIAVVDGLRGAVSVGADLVHAVALAQKINVASGGTGTVTVAPGTTVTVNSNLYPTANAAGIVNMIKDTSGFSVSTTATSAVFSKNGSPDSANCRVTYDASVNPPAISKQTSGC